jgi:hypothetical protein
VFGPDVESWRLADMIYVNLEAVAAEELERQCAARMIRVASNLPIPAMLQSISTAA